MGQVIYFPSTFPDSHVLSASLCLRPQCLPGNISTWLPSPCYGNSFPSCPQALAGTSLLLAL